MSKSKLKKAGKLIAESMVDGYEKMESVMLDTYKKTENAVVSGVDKMATAFEDRFLNDTDNRAKSPETLSR